MCPAILRFPSPQPTPSERNSPLLPFYSSSHAALPADTSSDVVLSTPCKSHCSLPSCLSQSGHHSSPFCDPLDHVLPRFSSRAFTSAQGSPQFWPPPVRYYPCTLHSKRNPLKGTASVRLSFFTIQTCLER